MMHTMKLEYDVVVLEQGGISYWLNFNHYNPETGLYVNIIEKHTNDGKLLMTGMFCDKRLTNSIFTINDKYKLTPKKIEALLLDEWQYRVECEYDLVMGV